MSEEKIYTLSDMNNKTYEKFQEGRRAGRAERDHEVDDLKAHVAWLEKEYDQMSEKYCMYVPIDILKKELEADGINIEAETAKMKTIFLRYIEESKKKDTQEN